MTLHNYDTYLRNTVQSTDTLPNKLIVHKITSESIFRLIHLHPPFGMNYDIISLSIGYIVKDISYIVDMVRFVTTLNSYWNIDHIDKKLKQRLCTD